MTNMIYTLQPGTAPLLVSMPHIGTDIPADLRAHYVPRALQVEDTDWHLARLYNFLGELGVSVLMPTTSRYVIDLNRPPDDAPMYPGASNTELCPTRFFTGEPLYLNGQAPDAAERARRRDVLEVDAPEARGPTMRPLPPSWPASRPSMATRCCGTHTVSAPRSHGCLTAACPT